MKKTIFFVFCVFFMLFSAAGVFAQQGFSGPAAAGTERPRPAAEYRNVTTNQLDALPLRTWVTLTGNITQSIGYRYYTFRDSAGEYAIEIESYVWRGLSITPNDRVEIQGDVDTDRTLGRRIVDVMNIRKL